MSRDGDSRYRNPRIPDDPQWPDCIVDDESRNAVAVEVTEFVCQSAVELNARSKAGDSLQIQHWTDEEIVAALKAIIRKKDLKANQGNLYSKVILVKRLTRSRQRQIARRFP